MNLLGILRQCRALYTNFTTQWASATPSGCPSMPMGASAVTIAPILGHAALTSSSLTPQWAWQNLLQWGAAASWQPHVDEIIEHVFVIELVQILLGVFVGLPFVFLAVHLVLLKASGCYRGLAESQQLVTFQHGVYAVLFGLSMLPQTYMVLLALFFTPTGTLLASGGLTYLLGLFVMPRFCLYLLEAVTRSVVKPNPLLVVLRIFTIATGFVVVLTKNPAALTRALLMDLGTVFEAPLYATLVARRLQWPVNLTRRLLRASVAWYAVTRVFQLVGLLYMVVGFAAMPDVQHTPEFIILSAAYLTYSVGSFATLLLYRTIDSKLNSDLMPAVLQTATGGTSSRLFCLWSRGQRRGSPHAQVDSKSALLPMTLL